ncbi:MAG: MBL fold metallo-hydrolase [Actinobacteria bacterium]|nr:MBL fold metallo-hydrolase [Actinomycetota bacterium]
MRGSTPCSGESLRRYGGNTACVVVEDDAHDPILFDLGTGLRFYGLAHQARGGGSFRGTALLTHLHWDHVQGIPFFPPLLTSGGQVRVHAPAPDDERLADTVQRFLSPPYFPVSIDALPGEITFHDTQPGAFEVGAAVVHAAWVPHCGPTFGYRVELGGRTVAYVSDHQQPGIGSTEVDGAVLDLCAGVDVLIHDAQFDDDEFALRSDWGHCTVDYAVEVAAQAGVGTLVLFHHDPSHVDERIDELLDHARQVADRRGVTDVLAAYEGLTMSLPAVRGARRRPVASST